jgi:hypothetical protein
MVWAIIPPSDAVDKYNAGAHSQYPVYNGGVSRHRSRAVHSLPLVRPDAYSDRAAPSSTVLLRQNRQTRPHTFSRTNSAPGALNGT